MAKWNKVIIIGTVIIDILSAVLLLRVGIFGYFSPMRDFPLLLTALSLLGIALLSSVLHIIVIVIHIVRNKRDKKIVLAGKKQLLIFIILLFLGLLTPGLILIRPYSRNCPTQYRRSDGCYPVDQLIVEFSESVSPERARDLVQSIGGTILKDMRENEYIISIPAHTEKEMRTIKDNIKTYWKLEVISVIDNIFLFPPYL